VLLVLQQGQWLHDAGVGKTLQAGVLGLEARYVSGLRLRVLR